MLLRNIKGKTDDNIKVDLMEIGIGLIIWPTVGFMEGFCEHGNEPSGLMKRTGYLD